MNKVLAVSGGVDSMVLFDLSIRGQLDDDTEQNHLIVAHFDHGTRESSKEDAEFVKNICQKHNIKFVSTRVALGENASEAVAREQRYQFLRKVASEYHAQIYTAHHLDDVAESIAINLARGTGWRGLAPMGRDDIVRPFLEKGWRKKDVLKYAGEHQLKFRQDPTNYEAKYLRNRLREKLARINDEDFQNLIEFFRHQQSLKTEIDQLLAKILPRDGVYQRKWFQNLDDATALEILRASLLQKGIRATAPQLKDFLNAIKTYAPEKSFNLPGDTLVKIHKLYYNI